MVALLKAPGATDGFVLFNFHMGTASTPDSPGANGESLRYVTDGEGRRRDRPGRRRRWSTCRSSGVDHADCQSAYGKVTGGQDLGDNTTLQRQRRRARVPEGARRRRLDGRRRRLRRQHQRRRRRRRRRRHHDVGQRSRARPAPRRRARRVGGVAQAAAADGAAVQRRRDASCGGSREAVLRMGQVREPNTATRKNNGMMLARLPPGEWHTGWVRDATYAVVALARIGPHRRGQGRARFLPERRARSASYASYVGNARLSHLARRATSATARKRPTTRSTVGPNIEIDGWGLVLVGGARSTSRRRATRPGWRRRTTFGTVVRRHAAAGRGAARGQPRDRTAIVQAPTRRSGKCTTRTRALRLHDAGGGARLLRHGGDGEEGAARTPTSRTTRRSSQKVSTAFLGAFVDSQGRARRLARGLSAAASTTTARWPKRSPGTSSPTSRRHRAKATLDAVQPPRASTRAASSATTTGSVVVRQQRVDPGRPAHLRRAAPRRARRRGRRLPVADRVDKAAANFYLLPELYNDTCRRRRRSASTPDRSRWSATAAART